MNNFQTWSQILDFFDTFILRDFSQNHSVDWGLNRTKKLLELLDNPQEKIPVIHVAGTSGKGSTSYLTANILRSQGLRVGLHLSPYLVDFRERCMFLEPNNSRDYDFPSEEFLVSCFQDFFSKFVNFSQKPTYFELVMVFTYYFFAWLEVDVAVVEVGMGGRYDASNVVYSQKKISILNVAGFDHMEVLGNTIKKISTEQAGIINPSSQVVAIEQEFMEAQEVIKEISKRQQANLDLVKSNQDFRIIEPKENRFLYRPLGLTLDTLPKKSSKSISNSAIELILKMPGSYQVANCALALRASEYFLQRKKQVLDWQKIKAALANLRMTGRFDEVYFKNKKLILDSAHNQQKMEAFIKALELKYPNQKLDFVLGFSQGKDLLQMLKLILPKARQVYFSDFKITKSGSGKAAVSFLDIQGILIQLGLSKDKFTLEKDLSLIFENFLLDPSRPIIVTGSMYFLARVYSFLTKSQNL